MCVILETIVFNYLSLYVSTLSLMLVHTCIILVSMYNLHCYSESVNTCIILVFTYVSVLL